MASFKSKFVLFSFVLLILVSCQTVKPFEMKSNEKDELSVITIESNRVRQECHFLNAEKENKWRHAYLIHLLNEKNEVVTAWYPITLDIEACTDHLKKVEKVLKKEGQLRLCLREKLEKDSREDAPVNDVIDFGPLGKHSSPYDYLTFDTICNSDSCVSISDTWTYSCPNFKNRLN